MFSKTLNSNSLCKAFRKQSVCFKQTCFTSWTSSKRPEVLTGVRKIRHTKLHIITNQQKTKKGNGSLYFKFLLISQFYIKDKIYKTRLKFTWIIHHLFSVQVYRIPNVHYVRVAAEEYDESSTRKIQKR